MFKVISEHVFWWPVRVRMPELDPEKAGQTVEATFDMKFAALSKSRAEELDQAAAEASPDARSDRGHEFFFEICRDWRDVKDQSGNPVMFERELLAQQLDYSWFRAGVLAAYSEAMSGAEARLGN